MTPADSAIARCVDACANARDGRGRWRVERECRAVLESAGTSPTVATMAAAASARLGTWIGQRAAALRKEALQ